MLEKLKGTFDKGVAAVSVKSESFVETSRTKTAISSAQKNMDAELAVLGSECYQAWKAGQTSMASFTERFERIRAIEQEIVSYNEYLEQIKEQENRILGNQNKSAAGCFCTNCGKALPAGSRFCDECGTPIDK